MLHMRSALAAAVILFPFAVKLVRAQGTTCNTTSLCPSSTPCCSEYGYCGTDEFCLGGCNPLHSAALDSCRPEPMCQSTTYSFVDNSRIYSNASHFDGNASAYDWVVNSGNIMNTNSSGGELALLLTEENGGTKISSTRYLHYGSVTATLKTGKWNGVVTAFITMSDVKDEIDWEFPGSATTEGQSNFFWQGVVPTGSSAGGTTKDLSDTHGNYHDYTIEWQPDHISWLVDGQNVRTIQATDYEAGKFPSTPSRVQLSIWPAGTNNYPEGTVEWAGGMIDWSDPDYIAAGNFYILVKSVSIKCGDQTTPNANDTSYVYSSNETNPEVTFSNASTLVDGALSLVGVDVRLPTMLSFLLVALALLSLI